MTSQCQLFRRLLATSLARDPHVEGRVELDWHTHLLGCGACRALLEAEEVLDLLLAEMPRPELPPELAIRVLARLRQDSLDRLLELDEAPIEASPALAGRVVDQARLEILLEQARDVVVPNGLAERVLLELKPHRSAPRLRLLRSGLLRSAAAAVLVLGVGVVAWRMSANDSSPERVASDSRSDNAPWESIEDEELLASLDLLDQFELVEELDPVALDVLVFLDVSDKVVLDLDLDSGFDGVEGEAR